MTTQRCPWRVRSQERTPSSSDELVCSFALLAFLRALVFPPGSLWKIRLVQELMMRLMQWSWQLHVWQQHWLWLQLAFCYFTSVQLQGREKDTARGVRKPSWLNRTQHLRTVNKNSMQSLSLRGTIGQAVQCDTNLRPTFVMICDPVLVTTHHRSLVLQTSAAQKSKLCFTACATLASTAVRLLVH